VRAGDDIPDWVLADDLPRIRANPEWQRIYTFFRRDYWHATTPENWESIKADGEIRPNIGGRYRSNFNKYEMSYSHKQEVVALFDFVGPTEDELIVVWRRAWDILTLGLKETSVLLRLDRNRLRDKMIPNSEGEATTLYVPYCEVWYPSAIAISDVVEAFRVPRHSGSINFRPEPVGMAETIASERREEYVEPLPANATKEEAVRWWQNNPNGPFPQELRDLLPELFDAPREQDDPVERKIREAGRIRPDSDSGERGEHDED